MRIWSILLIKSYLKWSIHLSRNHFLLYYNCCIQIMFLGNGLVPNAEFVHHFTLNQPSFVTIAKDSWPWPLFLFHSTNICRKWPCVECRICSPLHSKSTLPRDHRQGIIPRVWHEPRRRDIEHRPWPLLSENRYKR